MLGLLKGSKDRLVAEKIRMIDHVFGELGARSFADLGGVWGVEGGYTFHALDNHEVDRAVLVDTHFTKTVTERARLHSNLQLVQGNFGDQLSSDRVGEVDAVFLFDVLLHQVAPDWDEVLNSYARNARFLLIYNQQWIGSPTTVRLLELGEKEYFKNVPHSRLNPAYRDLFQKLDEKHPDHDRPWRDVHHIWQWGITDDALVDQATKLGFSCVYQKNCGRFGRLRNFENHAFIFAR